MEKSVYGAGRDGIFPSRFQPYRPGSGTESGGWHVRVAGGSILPGEADRDREEDPEIREQQAHYQADGC